MEKYIIDSLSLENFRKYERQTFKLDPHMNVFVGRNSSGKTTVLEAACVAMGAYLATYKEYVSSKYVYNISDSDILLKNNRDSRNALFSGCVTPSQTKQFPCRVACALQWNDKKIKFQRLIEKEGGRTKFDGKNPMQKMVSVWEDAIKKADGSDKEQIYPLVLYFSSARLRNENRVGNERDRVPARLDAYQRCLDGKRGIQSAIAYIKLLRNLSSEENDGKPYPAYEAILEALKYCFKEEIGEKQDIIFSSRYGEIVLKNADSTIIRFASLSDGYRSVIKIVADIATRMCILNPYTGAEVLKKTPGVVIIDELELSLHPSWQKRIISILKELFPNVQFICATHSPLIIQSLEDGELFVLDDIQE